MRGGRSEVVPRDFPHLDDFRDYFVRRMTEEVVRRLEKVLESDRRCAQKALRETPR